ncbi:hypothetical protein MRS76_21125 [Rhizobiaceae bacterium n13]|uniref:Uncharacterized protein n=1 Tax=Ferirhizobium litorale TaxID=2927786 RepID=A0AAE3U673_9HYPH|nr:hypothetical protein [Fererhizobium litorale]MDI7864440.1 hypothetical protein [Fererhizobium litorale]MDI7924809.1 hypothetical protein [Fererhizobium litorale]
MSRIIALALGAFLAAGGAIGFVYLLVSGASMKFWLIALASLAIGGFLLWSERRNA